MFIYLLGARFNLKNNKHSGAMVVRGSHIENEDPEGQWVTDNDYENERGASEGQRKSESPNSRRRKKSALIRKQDEKAKVERRARRIRRGIRATPPEKERLRSERGRKPIPQ